MKIETKAVTVTPDVALEYLKANTSNRTLNTAYVNVLADQMKKGRWKFTGESIKISENNVLLDGQHRLSAIVSSGIALDLLVTTGLSDDVFDALDSGKLRSAGDVLSTVGVENPKKVAAVAKFALLYNRGKYGSVTGGARSSRKSNYLVTNQDIREFVQNDPDIGDVVEKAMTLSSKFKHISFQIFGGMYYVLNKVDKQKCDQFFDKLVTGVNLMSDDPVYALREKFLRASANHMIKISPIDATFYIAKAWVLFKEDKRALQIRKSKTEKFPVV